MAIALAVFLLLLSLAAVFVLHAHARRLHKAAAPYPLLGHLPQFLANRHRILDWVTEVLARQPTCTLVFHRPGGERGVITANPANLEHVMRAGFDNYPKGPRFASALHDFLGRGILNVDGQPWRAQRKAASYEFSTRSLRLFVARSVHAELHGRLLPLLRRVAGSGCRLDLQDALERYAFDNICRVAFDHDPRQLPDGDSDESTAVQARAADGGRSARRHGGGGGVVRVVQLVRDGADGVGVGRGRAGVPAGAVAGPGGRDVPAGEPVPVHCVPRRAEDLPREGDGLHPDEVHRRVRGGGVRAGGGQRLHAAAGGLADVADGRRAPGEGQG